MAFWKIPRALAGRRPRSTTPVPLVLYTRPGCHLCDVMKGQIASARLEREVQLTEVSIETDPELEERYGRSIPVLEIAGRVAFKGRLEVADLERKFARIVAQARGESG